MDSAVWGFLGVVIGGVVTGAITIWAQLLRGRQEAELDSAKRTDERRAAREGFQQANLLELQVALDEWVGIELGRLDDTIGGERVPDAELRAADAPTPRLAYLTERVTDEGLRRRLTHIRTTIWSTGGEAELEAARTRLPEEARAAQEQIGALLRTYL
jgi:hypothetical protein